MPGHSWPIVNEAFGALDKHISMKHSIITRVINGDDKIGDLQHSLDVIEQKMDAEIVGKQRTIERQEEEIQRLHALIANKDKQIQQTSEKLAECANNNEGNRQLINKLLGDIDRLRQDIDWYKRTYEKRSFLGTVKEKFFLKK